MKIQDMLDEMECRCYSYTAPQYMGWSGHSGDNEGAWISWSGLWEEAKKGVHSHSETVYDGILIHEMEVKVNDAWERIENW